MSVKPYFLHPLSGTKAAMFDILTVKRAVSFHFSLLCHRFLSGTSVLKKKMKNFRNIWKLYEKFLPLHLLKTKAARVDNLLFKERWPCFLPFLLSLSPKSDDSKKKKKKKNFENIWRYAKKVLTFTSAFEKKSNRKKAIFEPFINNTK